MASRRRHCSTSASWVGVCRSACSPPSGWVRTRSRSWKAGKVARIVLTVTRVVARAPPEPEGERHGEWDHDELSSRHAARREADGDAATRLEPAGRDGRSGRHRDTARAERHEEPSRDADVPETLHVGGADRADAEQEQRHDDHAPGTSAIGKAADQGTGGAKEKERDRGGTGQGPPAPTELRLHGLDVDAENRAEPRPGHHAEGYGAGHAPRPGPAATRPAS